MQLKNLKGNELLVPSSFVRAGDRVLRHGMDFQYVWMSEDIVVSTCIAHAELFMYDHKGRWVFLGRWTTEFHGDRETTRILPLREVPLAGDAIFDRYF